MFSRFRAVSRQGPILRLLVARDLRVRYADSYLGYMWSILDPLLLALVFWFIFTKIISRSEIGADPYLVFLLLGLLPWNWFNGVVSSASRAITGESKLVRSTSLPREIWVMRLVGSKFAEFLLSIPIVVVFMLLLGGSLSWYLVAVPLAILIQLLLVTGLALMVASVTVLVADLQRVVKIILRLMFYLSPVIYSMSDVAGQVSTRVQVLYALNPMAGIIEIYHAAVFPDLFVGWWTVGISAVVSLVCFVVGWWVFVRLESQMLKEL